MTDTAAAIAWAVALVLLFAVVWRLTGRRTARPGARAHGPGPGAIGTIYDMLNEDKRNAVEIIVEEKAAERRPEYPDGNLPDLESPKRR